MEHVRWYHEPVGHAICASVAGTISLGLLVVGWRRLRQTTLVAPLAWGVVAAAAIVFAGWVRDPFVEYAAAVLLIAPTLAMLGAKRPQNGAWQFIVLTLIGVLLLPALQGLAYGDDEPRVHTLFRWLIGAHIVLGTVNYLPTRFAAAAFFLGAAQTLAAGEYLPFAPPLPPEPIPWAAGGCAAALLCAYVAGGRSASVAGMNRLWRDFRDAYGLVWGLRIAERLNLSATKHGWPVEFTWDGMLLREGTVALDAETNQRLERELRSHLRRFVSHDWIAERLHEPRA